MRLTRSVTGPAGTLIENVPSLLVTPPRVVPMTLTLAATIGSLLPSVVTRPVTRRVCANALVLASPSIRSDVTNERVILTPLSGWEGKGLRQSQEGWHAGPPAGIVSKPAVKA